MDPGWGLVVPSMGTEVLGPALMDFGPGLGLKISSMSIGVSSMGTRVVGPGRPDLVAKSPRMSLGGSYT